MAFSKLKENFRRVANCQPNHFGDGDTPSLPNESNEELARWRCWRLLDKRIGGGVCLRQKLEIRGCNQNRIFFRGWKFQLLHLQGELGFLPGFFRGRDGLANRTGIFAVKRAGHGFGKRMRA